jgi:hypothetical protein
MAKFLRGRTKAIRARVKGGAKHRSSRQRSKGRSATTQTNYLLESHPEIWTTCYHGGRRGSTTFRDLENL